MSQLSERFGLRLKCDTCGSSCSAVGYESFAKRDEVEAWFVNQHSSKFKKHRFTVSKDAYSAELTHVFVERTTRVFKTSSTAYSDVTDIIVSAGSLTAGKKYYIEVTAQMDNANVASGVGAKVVHGSTDFAVQSGIMSLMLPIEE
jgi:hypothetical protein